MWLSMTKYIAMSFHCCWIFLDRFVALILLKLHIVPSSYFVCVCFVDPSFFDLWFFYSCFIVWYTLCVSVCVFVCQFMSTPFQSLSRHNLPIELLEMLVRCLQVRIIVLYYHIKMVLHSNGNEYVGTHITKIERDDKWITGTVLYLCGFTVAYMCVYIMNRYARCFISFPFEAFHICVRLFFSFSKRW